MPNKYRIPKGYTYLDYQNYCLDKFEKQCSKDDKIAAFVMESGAQVAGGVVIFTKTFKKKLAKSVKSTMFCLF